MFDIFENSDCWFLESFKINGNQLTIGIAEGIISSAKEDVRIDKNTKIVVLLGGNSSEREISISSGKNVIKSLISKGLNIIPSVILIIIL